MTLIVSRLNQVIFGNSDQYKEKLRVSDWITRTQSEGMFGELKAHDGVF